MKNLIITYNDWSRINGWEEKFKGNVVINILLFDVKNKWLSAGLSTLIFFHNHFYYDIYYFYIKRTVVTKEKDFGKYVNGVYSLRQNGWLAASLFGKKIIL